MDTKPIAKRKSRRANTTTVTYFGHPLPKRHRNTANYRPKRRTKGLKTTGSVANKKTMHGRMKTSGNTKKETRSRRRRRRRKTRDEGQWIGTKRRTK